MDIREKVDKIIEILENKKAREISVINISNVTILADYFIICNGSSTTHIRTLADELEEKMNEMGYPCQHKEGYESSRWILLDYNEIVVHVFHEEERNYYNLERLWSDGITEHIGR